MNKDTQWAFAQVVIWMTGVIFSLIWIFDAESWELVFAVALAVALAYFMGRAIGSLVLALRR